MINRSNINFDALLPKTLESKAKGPTTPTQIKPITIKETKTQKKNRRAPELLYREDNLSTDVDAKLKESMTKMLDQYPIDDPNSIDKMKEDEKKVTPPVDREKITKENLLFNLKNVKNTAAQPSSSSLEVITPEPEETNTSNTSKATKKTPAKKASSVFDKGESNSKDNRVQHDVEEDDDAKFKKILVIQRYLQSPIFGPYLKELGKTPSSLNTEMLSHKSEKQLDKIISELRVYCRNKTSDVGLDNMLFGATKMIETTVSRTTRYNLNGWTMLMQHDQGLTEAWEAVKLERLSFVTMSPEVRLVYGMATNAMAVIALNGLEERKKAMAQQQAFMQAASTNAPVTPDTPDKPADKPSEKPKQADPFGSSFEAPPVLGKK